MSANKISVLVADDEPDIREIVNEFLSRKGYLVTTAENGKEALKKLRLGSFHLLLTDVIMPEEDGLGLVNKVLTEFPHLKVIIMSGGGAHLSSQQALAMPRALELPVITKPFALGDLLEKINGVLENEAL